MELPKDAKVLYRKLGFKSQLGYGRFASYSVNDLLYCMEWKGRQYLVWCYYNCSNISFIDPVLDELGIAPEKRIQKPGISPDLFEEYDKADRKKAWQEKYGNMTEEQLKMVYFRKARKRREISFARCVQSEIRRTESAESMAWRNQGHKK